MGYKIVRDRHEEWAREYGVSGTWRRSPDPRRALARKLAEEALEYGEQLDPAELGDVLDVVEAIVLSLGTATYEAVETRRMEKLRTLGGFSDLEWSPVPPEHQKDQL